MAQTAAREGVRRNTSFAKAFDGGFPIEGWAPKWENIGRQAASASLNNRV
jgi:hypothetical protein